MKPEDNSNRWTDHSLKRKEEEAQAWHEFRIKFLMPMLGLIFFVLSVAFTLWAVATMIKLLSGAGC